MTPLLSSTHSMKRRLCKRPRTFLANSSSLWYIVLVHTTFSSTTPGYVHERCSVKRLKKGKFKAKNGGTHLCFRWNACGKPQRTSSCQTSTTSLFITLRFVVCIKPHFNIRQRWCKDSLWEWQSWVMAGRGHYSDSWSTKKCPIWSPQRTGHEGRIGGDILQNLNSVYQCRWISVWKVPLELWIVKLFIIPPSICLHGCICVCNCFLDKAW